MLACSSIDLITSNHNFAAAPHMEKYCLPLVAQMVPPCSLAVRGRSAVPATVSFTTLDTWQWNYVRNVHLYLALYL